MTLKAPFLLPPGFLSAFGYHGGGRFVALFWEPGGDEACYDDGRSYACGCCDNWLYLDFTRQPAVRAWLDGNGVNLGNSDEPATHWLVLDAASGEGYAAPRQDAAAVGDGANPSEAGGRSSHGQFRRVCTSLHQVVRRSPGERLNGQRWIAGAMGTHYRSAQDAEIWYFV